MDKQVFVQNIKKYCVLRGIKPTVACRESGVGSSFINNIEVKGSIPSIEKVQILAQYLGVSTSELLGEETLPVPAAINLSQTALLVAKAYDQAGEGIQESIRKLLDVDKVPQESEHTEEAM